MPALFTVFAAQSVRFAEPPRRATAIASAVGSTFAGSKVAGEAQLALGLRLLTEATSGAHLARWRRRPGIFPRRAYGAC